jgi:predicted SnoaL-like aldol condensation-catalyzing enzyme
MRRMHRDKISNAGDSDLQWRTIMSDPQKNKELIEKFCARVFNGHDLSALECMRDDYIQHNPDCPQGKAGFTEFFQTIFKAIPDFRYSIKRIIAEADSVWMYCRVTGTHTGGPWLDVAASGNRLDFDVVDMFRIEDGKIAEHWDVADTYTLFGQLGRTK